MKTTAEAMRRWHGPTLFTYGFRPFFLGAALWAMLAMVAWIAMIGGYLRLPTAFDPVSWHAHELLFGYLGAVMAGFLLTAVPNWTGRLPIVGWPLAALFTLWVAGRAAVAFSTFMPPLLVAIADLALPITLALALVNEIVAGKNWRNLGVVGLLLIFSFGNAMFHWEAAHGEFAARGYGLRIALAAAVMMIALIGGRIVPSFTRNWLTNNAGAPAKRLPAPPEQIFDKIALIVLLAACGTWVLAPLSVPASLLLLLAGILHAVRLARWAGDRTGGEALVWVLHVGYAFVPLGALALGAGAFIPDFRMLAAGQHLWMAGAISMMTLAVMTRATLGHTGQALHAGRALTAIYLTLLVAVITRFIAGFFPTHAMVFYIIAGLAWIGGYGLFIVLFWPLLCHERKR